MRRALTLLLCLPAAISCYTYAPVDAAALHPGTSVRVRLSAAGAERIAPLLSTADARLLDGKLLEHRADTIVVEVPTVMQAYVGSVQERLHQRIAIPRSDLLEVETRRLDRVRTGGVVGAVAVIVGTIAIRALTNDPGRDRGPPDGGGNENKTGER